MKNRLKRALSLLITIAMVGGLLSVSAFAADRTMDLTVLATSDLHGRLLPMNYATGARDETLGLTKIATMISEVKAAEKNVLLVDGGDTIQGTPLTYYYAYNKPEVDDPMMKALRLMDYDMWTFGNHEFNYGLDILTRQAKYLTSADNGDEHQVAACTANFVKEGTEWDPWFGVPYVTKTYTEGDNTLKVGVLGLDTPNIPAWEGADHYKGIDFRNFTETVNHYMPILREQEKCDVVIVVAHSGIEDEETAAGAAPANYENQVRDMIEHTSGIDAVVSGHVHKMDYITDLKNQDGVTVPVLSGGREGNGLAYLKLTYDFDTKTVTPAAEGNGFRYVKDQKDLKEDAKLATAFAPYLETINGYLDESLGTATGDFSNDNVSLQPTALMDLLNKAQLAAVPAQLSICAPLTSGSGVLLPKGEIPLREMYQLYKYENWLYRIKMTGDQLRLWLEHSTLNYESTYAPNGFGGGLYTDEIYGLDYEIHYYAPEGSRVKNMSYQGRPVQPNDVFTVVINNYRFTGGHEFMQAAGLKPGDDSLQDLYTYDTMGVENGQARNILAQYIRDQKTITPTVDSTWKFFRTEAEAINAGANQQVIPTIPEPPAEPVVPVTPVAPAGTYTVQQGDSLWSIAQKYTETGRNWPALYELNKDTIKDANWLTVGQILVLPANW